ncbi:hypothetical protein [Streptomyces klenkii]|uniref:hypothetical protein n=1 Tax=Streptomyces klenkii TaxID=1420899 RepID=UPI0011C3C7D0|nr:hypothetical protein [Streptomyces klenkii]
MVVHPLPQEEPASPQGPAKAGGECDQAELEEAELKLWLDADGWPVINGHRVTPALCAALRRRHPWQAEHFQYEEIIALSRRLGRPLPGDAP